AARIDGGGGITEADIQMLARLLKDSDGKTITERATEIAKIDAKAEPALKVLQQMATIVSHYYFAQRPLFDYGTGEYHTGEWLNLPGKALQDLTRLEEADKAEALIGALAVAFGNAISDTDFNKELV